VSRLLSALPAAGALAPRFDQVRRRHPRAGFKSELLRVGPHGPALAEPCPGRVCGRVAAEDRGLQQVVAFKGHR
jgi:hypothetical protein